MKQLSIEEKAKRYDEAIKYAHYLINERCKKGTNGSFHRADLERMFPVLAESEDERNIKDLIDELKCSLRAANCQNDACGGGHEKRIALLEWSIAWLEKQEQKSTWSEEDKNMLKWVTGYLNNKMLNTSIAEERTACKNAIVWIEKQANHVNFCNKIQIGDKVTRNKDGVLVNLSQLNRIAKPAEKQGEQKSLTIDIKSMVTSYEQRLIKNGGISNSPLFNMCVTAFKHGIENTLDELHLKQGEQKPADKVEPKFKVKYAGSEYNVFETKNIAGVTYYGIEDESNHIDYVKADNCEIISGYGIKENGSPYPTKPAVFSEQKPFSKIEPNILIEESYQQQADDLIDMVTEKPADKNEPKFYKGEWLCENEPNNYARFIQILEIVNVQGKDRYRISRDIHKDEDIVEFGFVEKYYHKFDIKDAKDGDVLSYREGQWIFIYKGFGKEENEIAYYALLSDEGLTLNNYNYSVIESAFSPVTKEQRDTLMKAMTNAGYAFDFEKKELKKIEQNPAEEYNITGIGSKKAQGKLGEMIKKLKG